MHVKRACHAKMAASAAMSSIIPAKHTYFAIIHQVLVFDVISASNNKHNRLRENMEQKPFYDYINERE